MKKRYVIIITILMVVLVGMIGFKIFSDQHAEERGEEKFRQAISEIIVENPELNNPCLGTHVTRWNSYGELDKKSIEEIKQIAKQAPSDC